MVHTLNAIHAEGQKRTVKAKILRKTVLHELKKLMFAFAFIGVAECAIILPLLIVLRYGVLAPQPVFFDLLALVFFANTFGAVYLLNKLFKKFSSLFE